MPGIRRQLPAAARKPKVRFQALLGINRNGRHQARGSHYVPTNANDRFQAVVSRPAMTGMRRNPAFRLLVGEREFQRNEARVELGFRTSASPRDAS